VGEEPGFTAGFFVEGTRFIVETLPISVPFRSTRRVRAPTLLMQAIVDAAHEGERDELLLADAALHRMAAYERDELEDSSREFRPFH
jgi:hypothetical protein